MLTVVSGAALVALMAIAACVFTLALVRIATRQKGRRMAYATPLPPTPPSPRHLPEEEIHRVAMEHFRESAACLGMPCGSGGACPFLDHSENVLAFPAEPKKVDAQSG